ncbi:MAG: hypothetical protein OXL34_02840 [Gemmatimonadota bacterium]|nr:hypothetical protein [Gemmatimonadota bacterium]
MRTLLIAAVLAVGIHAPVAASEAPPEFAAESVPFPLVGGLEQGLDPCTAFGSPAVQCRGHLAHAIYWAGLCGIGLTAWGAAKKVFSILKEAKKLAKKKKVTWKEAITQLGKAAMGACGGMFVTIGLFIECHFGAHYAGDDTDDDIDEIWREIERLMDDGAEANA